MAIIEGRRPIATITSNADGEALDLTFAWKTPALASVTAIGQIVPLSGSIAHSASIKTIRDNKGNEVSLFITNEKIIIEVVAVPMGVSGANTIAAALSAAQFPAAGGWLTIGAAPVLVIGSFTDAFNSANWSYNCDGRVELVSEGEWGMRFSCTRYANIAAQAAVVL